MFFNEKLIENKWDRWRFKTFTKKLGNQFYSFFVFSIFCDEKLIENNDGDSKFL